MMNAQRSLNSHNKCLRDFIVHLHMYIDRFIHAQIAVKHMFHVKLFILQTPDYCSHNNNTDFM